MLEKIEGKGERVAEDEMIGRHHRFNGHELGQTPGAMSASGVVGSGAPSKDALPWILCPVL